MTTDRIRYLNDEFRRTFEGGTVVLTKAVSELPPEQIKKIVDAVKTFKDFTEEDDPHGEHDFGAFEVDGRALWFKIDCYDKNKQLGSENPADPEVTSRVLTILFPEDY